MGKAVFTRIPPQSMCSVFYEVLVKTGLNTEKALQCAEVFTTNSLDGVYSHGVNRFAVFVENIKEGLIDKNAAPSLTSNFGSIEQWNGNLAPGPLNAIFATERAMELATQTGISCVAMANTNHWMRGGYYGWMAARQLKVLIAWTNTTANMPAWNALDARLGNNPLVLALPYNDGAIVLDMAMSQFSFGALEMAAMKNDNLPVPGGYDNAGNLTDNPVSIIETKRVLPAGYWKGAGLSLLLDILATIISGGLSTMQITKRGKESGVSQVFICIDPAKLHQPSVTGQLINDIITNYHESIPGNGTIYHPGERVEQARKENSANGIPVLQKVWENILTLR